MADCLHLAQTLASWDFAVVPARVNKSAEGEYHKGSVKGWPARASALQSKWAEGWFTWGGDWHVAICPRQGGAVALDCDGTDSVDLLREAINSKVLPWTGQELCYSTPGHGGGLHVVWRWPKGLPTFSRKVVTLESGAQLDLRGEGTFLLTYGAPRPDLPEGSSYKIHSRPGEDGPPEMPLEVVSWMESLGQIESVEAPSIDVKQKSPEQLVKLASSQGGKIRVDRHSHLFALASYLRVRKDTKTFEALAHKLWELVQAHFEIVGEEEHWKKEVIRVSKNAIQYTQERDQKNLLVAQAALKAANLL